MRDMLVRSCSTLALLATLAATSLGGSAHAQTAEAETRPAGSFSGAVLAAKTAERDADHAAAIRFLSEALRRSEGDEPELEQALLRAFLLDGRFDDAVRTATKLEEDGLVDSDPQSLILLTLVSDALASREYRRAVQLLDVSGVNDLDELVFGSLLAWAHAGLGEPEAVAEALAEIDNDGRPDWVRFYGSYMRGMVAEQTGDVDAARAAYTAALDREALGAQLRDTYGRAVAALAGLELRAGDEQAALAALERGEQVVGAQPIIAWLRDRIENAEAVPAHVSDVADGASELLYGVGMALSGSRAGDLARNYLHFANALSPEAAAPLIGLAQLEEVSGRSQEAIDYYEQVPETSPLHAVAVLQEGLNLADLEKLDEAIKLLNGAREENPDDVRVTLALGNTLAIAENWEAAAELYDDALERIAEPQTNDWILFYRRAIANERLKQWPKAEKDFLQALDLRPDHPPVLNYLGYSWIDMNMNLERGLEMIKKAVSLQPNSGAYVDSLGWAYYRLGRFEEAVKELERALQLETSDPVIHDHLGDAYWRVGREREARFQWGHALKMDLEEEDRRRIRRKLTTGLEPVAEDGKPKPDDDRA